MSFVIWILGVFMLVLRARAVGADKRHWNAKPALIVAALVALLAGGCTAVPPPPHLAAADPNAPVPAVRYSAVTAPYTRQRPVEPLPWRERNERVAPQAGQ
jgi:hypothetical protein